MSTGIVAAIMTRKCPRYYPMIWRDSKKSGGTATEHTHVKKLILTPAFAGVGLEYSDGEKMKGGSGCLPRYSV
jgi:hypothetical protein